MASGRSAEEYCIYVEKMLGGDIVKVELDMVDVKYIVNRAFQEIKRYISDVETMTLPYSPVIDLSGKKIANIVYIMRGNNTNGPGGFQDVMYIYSRQSALSSYSLTDYARALIAQQNKNSLATDLDFHYDKREEKLYLYAQQALPTTVTIVYTPDYSSVEEIIEPFWQDYIQRLALALTKEAVGRVRSKYDLASSTYKLDGQQLVSEGREEQQAIREFLGSNSDMLLPID